MSDLLGKSLGRLTVTADTARHVGDDAVVLSKKPFTVAKSDEYVNTLRTCSTGLYGNIVLCVHVLYELVGARDYLRTL